MKHKLGLSLTLSLGIAVCGALSFSTRAEAQAEPLPVQELRAFAEIFGRVKQDYVEPVEDRKLLEDAIRGMLSGLDPHSSYLGKEEYKELKVGTQGEFGGLGIEVGMEDGFIRVISPIDDTPAQRAGIQAGDLIIRLDEKPVKGMSLDEAINEMRGEPGTELKLTIIREGKEKPVKLTIVRAIIKVASVKGRVLEEGYGYLRISHFQSRTTEDMLKRLSELKAESEEDLRGMVLDLRNNPGGILSGAVSVSDAFLTDGVIVYTQGREETSRMDFNAAPDDVLEGLPIVVLVNGGSASASEIVAGALQDHKRAIIMGSKTFGKGSVQTIVPITEDTAVKLTTARYFTPNGRSIQAEGIKPDIEIENIKVAETDDADESQVKESDLNRHLANGNGKKAVEDKEGEAKKGGEEKSLVQKDFILNEALNLLKGLYILRGQG
ncbi:MAG: S41 family peptidase [Candidatus Sedimenticola sp. (ex Thyasira tokunagai)]